MYKFFITTALLILSVVASFAEETVEVMGNISVTKTYAYVEPDFDSKALARLNKNSKVLILGQDGDWMKVRLYNKSEAYVYAKYVSLKFENITRKESEVKALIDINNLLDQFNDIVQSSWFAEKQKIVPALKFHSGKTPDDISLLYTAVNSKDEPVPSLKENPLSSDMVKLIELIYMKMIVLTYDRYKINIVVPDFISGTYKGKTENYVSLTLQKNFANLDEIKGGTGSIWDYVRSAKRPEEMFNDYPH
ncbi:MAG: hypothetical protein C0602_01865 [Denitrovibrio sp.]|nr:MAG: hypothetical protein C0602_01865 [Denitrovibrio sp.]